MTQFLRTCFAASTPLRWSVAEDVDATAALEIAAVSLAKSEAEEEDACCSNLEADEVRCTTCEVDVDSEVDAAAVTAAWETRDEDAAAVAAAIPPDAPLMLLDLCLHRWRLKKW